MSRIVASGRVTRVIFDRVAHVTIDHSPEPWPVNASQGFVALSAWEFDRDVQIAEGDDGHYAVVYPHTDPYQEAFWRGACAGVAASFDGFAEDFAASDSLNCDWRVDGCRQIASNMRAHGGAS